MGTWTLREMMWGRGLSRFLQGSGMTTARIPNLLFRITYHNPETGIFAIYPYYGSFLFLLGAGSIH